MVDYVNHRAPDGASESSVLGPFYREGAEVMAAGSNISKDGLGEPVIVSGRVSDLAREPIEGAVLDVWQTSPVGLYENQDPEQPEMNLRGKFLTDEGGCYRFRTVRPSSYPIAHDGPAGRLLRALGRHPYRPAHIHFVITAKGYAPLTTQLCSCSSAAMSTSTPMPCLASRTLSSSICGATSPMTRHAGSK
jgi:protocatechuate 3,4-dioxygenase beta subunit